jgi:hypothetical protein
MSLGIASAILAKSCWHARTAAQAAQSAPASSPIALAAIAIANLWAGRDFQLQVGRDWGDLEMAGGV